MSEKFLRDIEGGSIKEQSPKEEKKEGKEGKEGKEKEIQRLELDPEENIDIVIKEKEEDQIEPQKLEAVEFMEKHYDCKPLQVLIEKNGKVIEDFTEATPVSVEIYYTKKETLYGKKKDTLWVYIPRELLFDEFATEAKDAIIIPSKWKSPEEVLSFFHELGHSIISFKRNLEIYKKEDKKEDKEEDKEEKYGRAQQLKYSAWSERNAWAEALRLVRKLRKKGIDVLKPFRDKETGKLNWDKFTKRVHEGLALWEARLRVYEGIVGEKLKGIFTKKYSEEEIEKLAKNMVEAAKKQLQKEMEEKNKRE